MANWEGPHQFILAKTPYTFLCTCPSGDLILKTLCFYTLPVFLSQYSFWSRIQRYSGLSSTLALPSSGLPLFRSSAFLSALGILVDRPRRRYKKTPSFFADFKFGPTHFKVNLYFPNYHSISHQSFVRSFIIMTVYLSFFALWMKIIFSMINIFINLSLLQFTFQTLRIFHFLLLIIVF